MNTQKPSEEWEIEIREITQDENGAECYFRNGEPLGKYLVKYIKALLHIREQEAIQATREETMEKITNVDLTEKYQEKAQDLWDTNDFDDSDEAEHWEWLAHNYDEVIDDILDSLKAQKKGIRR